MKTHLFLPALGLAMLMAACQKDELPVLGEANDTFLSASERCGCLPPVTFDAKNATDVSGDISWNAMPEAINYRVELSKRYGLGDRYFLVTTENNQITLTGLAPNTHYKYHVITVCGNMESSASATMYFETKESVHGDPVYPSKAYSTQ